MTELSQVVFLQQLVLAADVPSAGAAGLGSAATILLAVCIFLYLAVLMGISLIASKKVVNEEDYLVAGRSLPLFLCWGSLIATWFGAASMMAASEAAKQKGLLGVILDPFACSATLILAGLCFAGPMWRLKLLTTGDFFRRAYGPTAEIVAGCIQVPAYFGWIALQFKALADVQNVYFGIERNTGIFVACAVTLSYTMVGGMWSVTLTDSLQIIIAFGGLLILAYSTYSSLGEGSAFAGFDKMLTETPPEMLTLLPPATAVAILAYSGTWATGLFGNIPGQDLQQRIFSAKDSRTASAACIWAGIIYLIFGMIPVGLGLVAQITDPDIDGKIIQLLAGKYLNQWMAVVFVLSFISIVVSTATGAMLAPATILSHNLLGRFKIFKGRGLVVERGCVFLVAAGAIVLAYSGESNMGLLDLSLSMQLVALFVPLAMGLYARPRSKWSGILAMSLGFTAFMTRYLAEKIFFAVPTDLAAQGVDFLGYMGTCFPNAPGLARDLATVPADLYGLGASIFGYLLGQAIFFRSAPINDDVLKQAWPDAKLD